MSATVIGYTYAGFPALLWLRARYRPRRYRAGPAQPRVSVVVAAHNESTHIAARIENLLSARYPPDRLEVIIASDGSTDGTDDIVRRYEKHGVRLLSLPRAGKARALNVAVPEATGEIIVFTDANTEFSPDAIAALVRPFADPQVGGVAGDQRYFTDGRHHDAGEQSYWNLDRLLKTWESAAGNVVQATGAIYAVRRELVRPVPDGVSDDFVTSVAVIDQGFRLVFAPEAIAYEPTAPTDTAEFQRKVRIGTRMLRSELHVRHLFNPFRHGFYALQLFSHKPLRRLMAFPVLAMAMSNVLLWRHGALYRIGAIAQLAFYGSAALTLPMSRLGIAPPRFMRLPAYFCLVYAAQLAAVWKIVRGQRISLWDRRGPSQ